jgi:hypothetical protein
MASFAGVHSAVAQNPTGVIDGIVRDPSGQPVPGVSVIANSLSLIQRDLAATSNVEGYYRLQLLPPGTYTVRYELQGFQIVVREGLLVAAGQTTSVNIELGLSSVEESVTVVGESPTVDPTSAKLGFTTTEDLVENVPTRRDFSALMATIPGVEGATSNTTQAGNFPRLVVLGAGTMANSFTFDGANVLDAGISSDQTAKFSYDIVEEAQVLKAAKPAEIGFAPGGSFQIVTKSGGNDFHGEGGAYFRDDALQSNNVTDDLRALGVTSTSNAVVQAYDVAISPGGRFIRDKLWWYGSARHQREELQLLGYPDDQVSTIKAYFWKNTLQASPGHRFTGSFQDWSEEVVPFFRGFAPSLAGDRFATFVRKPFGQLTSGRWNGTLSNTVIATAGMAHGKQTLDAVYPDGASVGIRDLVTGVRVGSPDVLQKRAPSWNTNVSGSLSWFVPDLQGRHDFKVGAEYTASKVINEMFSVGDHQLRVNNGVPAQVVFFDTPATGDARIDVGSAYLQDSWVIRNKLTLNLGIRYDRFVPHREQSQAGGGTWANTSLAQTYPILQSHPVAEVDPQWVWNSFAPRLAGSYAITPQTVFRGSYSRYYHYVNTGMIPGADENVVTSLIVQWNDLNGDRRFQSGEEGRLLSFAEGASRVRFDPDIRHPFTDEIVLGFSRELFTDFSVNANMIWRRDDDLIHTVQVGIPDSAYTPRAVADPGADGTAGTGDDGTLTVFAQDPTTFGQEAFLETNPSQLGKDNDRAYRGFEFVANKRLSNRWQFVGSVVVQRMESLTPTNSFYTTGLFQNPNDQINARGRDPLSETVNVKLQGIYQAPFGFLLSGYYRYGSGTPIARALVVRGLPQGTITVLAETRGERETPASNLLDFRVEKAFRLGAGQRLMLGLDIFNVTNASTVTSQGVSTGVDLGRPRVIVNPRIARIGVRYVW